MWVATEHEGDPDDRSHGSSTHPDAKSEVDPRGNLGIKENGDPQHCER